MITGNELLRAKIERVWDIDRSEVIDKVYYLENGTLVLRPQHHDVPGWPPGEAEKCTPILLDCFDRGGWFHGAFADAKLAGVVVLDRKRIGKRKDQLQLKFLHVSSSYRNRFLSKWLFDLATAVAQRAGSPAALHIGHAFREHG